MSQQKLVDIPFFDLSIENRKRLVFGIYFFNARVPEARKHKCEYIGKESPAYSKKRMGKEGYPYVVPTALWNNQFFMLYMASIYLGSDQEYPVKELVKELMKDRMFYEQSGGGVTLSGGEVMAMSTDYILQIAKALKKEEISLTIDTCGYVSYDKFEAILPYVDTFLYDVKVKDPELHKKYIGVDNKLILDNLVKLSDAGARIYIRIPTIKEVNGNVQNMEDTIHFLKKHGIHPAQVNLLPYHNTGSSKYPKLGMEYKGTDLHAPEKEEMESFVKLFQDAGYTNTKIGG